MRRAVEWWGGHSWQSGEPPSPFPLSSLTNIICSTWRRDSPWQRRAITSSMIAGDGDRQRCKQLRPARPPIQCHRLDVARLLALSQTETLVDEPGTLPCRIEESSLGRPQLADCNRMLV